MLTTSYNKHKDCVVCFLNKVTELLVNKCDNNVFSPLFVASEKCHTTILEMLYNRAGDIGLCNKNCASTLYIYIASYNGHKARFDFLLNKGVEAMESQHCM